APSRRRWLGATIVGLAACVAIAALVAIPIFQQSTRAEATPPGPSAKPTAGLDDKPTATPAAAASDPAVKPADKPWEQLTMRDLERQQNEAAAAAGKTNTPAAATDPATVATAPTAPTGAVAPTDPVPVATAPPTAPTAAIAPTDPPTAPTAPP